MRNASNALKTLLVTSTEFAVCDLLTIEVPSHGQLLYTSADVPISVVSSYDGIFKTFLPNGPPFTRGATKLVRGFKISSMRLTINARPGDTVQLPVGVGAIGPWPYAARLGVFDGCTICIEKLIAPSFADTSAGTLIQFLGRVGQVTPSRYAVEFEVRAAIDQLSAQFPRNVFQPGCLHTLYDSGCTLIKSAFASSAVTLAAGSTTTVLRVNGLANPSGYFDQGTFSFISGPNTSVEGVIASYVNGSPSIVVVQAPLPQAPTAGDFLVLYPGCDKTQNTCTAKFSNLPNFRGMPYVPKVEAAR